MIHSYYEKTILQNIYDPAVAHSPTGLMYIVFGLVILVHRNIQVIKSLISTSKIDVLCIDETKLDTSFPDSQFKIEGYQFPLFRKDGDSKGYGKIVSVLE